MLGDTSENVKQLMSDVPAKEFSDQLAVIDNSGYWSGRQAQ